MSGKKQAKAVEKVVAAPVVKKSMAEQVKRDASGKKIMKVARGTERALRRAGLTKNWRFTGGAKQMLPAAV